ncbi:hypothetical protein KIW84_031433 [Lathyrus oleraceus]|uniref:pyruvate decarboxylase n=1 Tax=Pisum sativum TaxID=3888 RepID=A0A9D4XSD3_PEA|nr:hypothetical protein KIW84_031433 [Pisum sativum]
MNDLLKALAKRLKHNNVAYENYHRIFVPDGTPLKSASKEPLRVNVMFQHIQKMLSSETTVIAETGDSWFNCQKLKLPKGCGYEFQMQYGSIGSSVGETLGYAQAVPEKRVIACIGDGSFQVTAQDVSIMLCPSAVRCLDNLFSLVLEFKSVKYIFSIIADVLKLSHPFMQPMFLTGDSWFNYQKLKLPEGCGYEFQMQYGSIGWSVGATLGYAQAVPEKRVIACIGDGSFQVTAQDVSIMLCPSAVRCLDNLFSLVLEFKSVKYIFSIIADVLKLSHPFTQPMFLVLLILSIQQKTSDNGQSVFELL